MLYNLKGTNLSADQHRSYIEKRLAPLDRYFGKKAQARADVELQYLKDEEKQYRAEATLHDHGLEGDFRAEALGETLHEAIDIMCRELNLELSRHKKRLIHHKRRGAALFKDIIRGFTRRGESEEE